MTAPKVLLLDNGWSTPFWHVEIDGRKFSLWVPEGEPNEIGRVSVLDWYRFLLDPRLPLEPYIEAIRAVRHASVVHRRWVSITKP